LRDRSSTHEGLKGPLCRRKHSIARVREASDNGRRPSLDFDHLNIFLEVARQSSFSRAAEKCFRTQPAISAQIRALEDEVGAKLFDRSGGKVTLTGAGKAFQRWAEEMMSSRRGILSQIAEMEKVPRGEIVVAANEATCLHILPEVFGEFKKRFADVNVAINRAERGRILEMVLDNVADFGVVSGPVEDARLKSVTLHCDELVIITAPHHPLASFKSVTVEDVANYPLLLPKQGRTREAITEMFHSRRLKPRISMELDSSELLKRFVAADVGIGLIARYNVLEDVQARVLAVVSIADARIKRDLVLVYRKDKTLGRAAQAFLKIAVKIKTPAAEA